MSIYNDPVEICVIIVSALAVTKRVVVLASIAIINIALIVASCDADGRHNAHIASVANPVAQ